MLTFSECTVKDIDRYLTHFDQRYGQQTSCFISSRDAASISKGVAVSTFWSGVNSASAPAGVCKTMKIGFEDDSSFYFWFYEMANGFVSWYSSSIELYLYRDSGANRWVISPFLGSCEYCKCSTRAVIYEGADVNGDTAADATNRVWTPFAAHSNQHVLSVTCADASAVVGSTAKGNHRQSCVEPKTCAQLGSQWPRIANGVCSARGPNLASSGVNMCASTQTYHSAINKCAKEGARLCSVQEIKNGAGASAGCSQYDAPVWTLSWCGLGNKRYVIQGNGAGELQCKSSVSADERYAMRCCSDSDFAATTKAPAVTTTTSIRKFNQKSCATLGWLQSSANSAVCAESSKGFELSDNSDKCFYAKMQPDANIHCSEMGGRLCTLDEISQGAGRNTGCNMDSWLVWTDTSCGDNKYWTAKYCEPSAISFYWPGTQANVCSECTSVEELRAMRCCSDTYPRYGALQSKGAKIAQIAKSAKVGKAGGIALFAVVGAACAAALMVGAAVKMFIGRGGELNSAPLVPSNEKDLVEELDEKAPLQPKDTQAAAPSSKNRPDSP